MVAEENTDREPLIEVGPEHEGTLEKILNGVAWLVQWIWFVVKLILKLFFVIWLCALIIVLSAVLAEYLVPGKFAKYIYKESVYLEKYGHLQQQKFQPPPIVAPEDRPEPTLPTRFMTELGNMLYTEEQRYPCQPELLEQFFHEEPVPGLDIVCFDKNEQGKLAVKYYRGTVPSTERVLELPMDISWEKGLRSILPRTLRVNRRRRRSRPKEHNHDNEEDLEQEEDHHHHGEEKQPWALFTPSGERIIDGVAVEETGGLTAKQLANKVGMTLLYHGGQFIWPGVRVGFQRTVALYTIMPEESPYYDNSQYRAATLETLSLSPLVLSVQGFLSDAECQHIQAVATPTMEYSGVVLMDHDEGRPASDFRTSQTTFVPAHGDAILTDIDYRTASLVRIPRSHQEHVQVLRYGEGEKYVSHHDYFDPNLYQKDASTLELIRHGVRNRLATVFWYLTTVEEGGETVFPRAFGNTETSFEDCETGLKVKPEAGKVIIFYSMTPDGNADPKSLHGACPVKKGIKWAANKWVWNEPMNYIVEEDEMETDVHSEL